MNVYEYFNTMQLGLPITTVISNYLVDLKVSNRAVYLRVYRLIITQR
jgi:hypothetical protein